MNLKSSTKILFGFILAALLSALVGVLGAFNVIGALPMFIVIAVTAVVIISLGFFMTSNINKPLEDLNANVEQLATGDVNVRFKHDGDEELSKLTESLNKIAENMRHEVEMAKKIAAGDLSVKVNAKSDKDILGKSMDSMVENLRRLIEEAGMLEKAAVEGKLDTRGDVEKFQGGYKDVIQGFNNTLDAVIGPLNVAAEYVERISVGDIPPEITEEYKGDFNEIKNSLNHLIEETRHIANISEKLSVGNVNVSLEKRSEGDLLVDSLQKVIANNQHDAECLQYLSQGNLDIEIKVMSEDDMMAKSAVVLRDTLKLLIKDMDALVEAALAGKLDTRADASKHEGDFAMIVKGVNDTLDAVIGPLNVAAEYVERISVGDIPPVITDDYTGDFNEIKNNLNHLIEETSNIAGIAEKLSVGNTNVKLEKRSDGDLLVDSLQKVIANNQHDAENVQSLAAGNLDIEIKVMSEDDVMAKSALALKDTLKELIKDMDVLVEAALAGKLDTRADASKHEGDFATIVKGVNDTLDAVIGPLNVAAEYVERISVGDIPPVITDDYTGDFNEIKNNLNHLIEETSNIAGIAEKLSVGNTNVKLEKRSDGDLLVDSLLKVIANNQHDAENIQSIASGNLDIEIKVMSEDDVMAKSAVILRDTLKQLVSDMDYLTEAAVEGKLDTRVDIGRHEGEYANIIQGVNNTLDAVIGPLNVAAEYIERISKGNIPPEITENYAGDFNEIKNNLNMCIDAINGLVDDANSLVQASFRGDLKERADINKHEGDFKNIVSGVNKTLDVLVGHMDTMPVPVMIIDKDFSIRYMNKVGVEILGSTQEQIIGQKCYDGFKTSHCNTDKCACGQAMKQDKKVTAETDAHPMGMDLEISYTGLPIKDENQEIIGAIELVVDQTESKNAFRIVEKQTDYQEKEVEKVLANLSKIASGDLDCDFSVAEADEDTRLISENYKQINQSLSDTVKALNNLMNDIDLLATAAEEGNLDTRADVSRHGGDYAKIVEGVNNTLAFVIEPVKEAATVLSEMARGNFQKRVTGDYKGDHAEIKTALNDTLESLASYIKEISQILNEIANSNLNLEVTGDYRGEFSEIKDALNLIIANLNEVLGEVHGASEQVASASKQVSDSSMQLSQGTTEQASSIEELTASIEEISTQTRQNAENSKNAQEISEGAKINAEKGNQQMQEMLGAMSEINESSNSISKIIKVIDEIAFQTNILALNAAVEAARAGQHGKGFAVVAEEVSNLAERSANAAKETTEMIEGSINKVEHGTEIANLTSEALNEIVDGVAKAANLVGEITEASDEQATAVDQISQGITQISDVVQTSSATSEETASASEEMSSQAEVLKDKVSQFKLKVMNRASSSYIGNLNDTDAKKPEVTSANKIDKIVLTDQELGKY